MHAARTLETVRFVGRTYRTLQDAKAHRLTPGGAGERIARDVARMGPLYIKMAQFISARRDAINPEFVEALSLVQDRVPSGTATQPPALAGYSFEPVPIGSASIASVFKGTHVLSGEAVVVKQRRAGVKEQITIDLPLLLAVMTVASLCGVPGARNMCELIEESRSMLLSELDFNQEARAQTEFRNLMQDIPWLIVPRVMVAAEDFMVSAYVPSHHLREVQGPNAALAQRLMDMYMTMLDRGFVHADPHPGNVGILRGGRVVLYDFGAMLRVDPSTKEEVARLLQSCLAKDADGAMARLERMGVIRIKDGKRTAVRQMVRKVISGNMHQELQSTPEFTDNHKRVVAFGQTFIYLARTLSLVDASCRALDPDFSYDFSKWIDSTADMTEVVRDVISIPATVHTMQQDMEEFQTRIMQEIDASRQGMSHLAHAAAVFFLIYFLF